MYVSFTLKIPMATAEERMTIRLMLPLNGFEESGVRPSYWNVHDAVGWDLRGLDGRFQNTEGTVNSGTDEYYL